MDTATTEIYTYLHTLSLHDALPIFRRRAARRRRRAPPDAISRRAGARNRSASVRRGFRPRADRVRHRRYRAHGASNFRAGGRSEEHTSELQSLMRISYAVFCLKKKKKIQM